MFFIIQFFYRSGLLYTRLVLRALVGLGAMLFAMHGYPAEGTLSLAEALRIAERESRQLVSQNAAVAAAREMAVSAGQLPDPVLRAGIENLPVEGMDRFSLGRDFMTMRRIGVMQEITNGEKRSLRVLRGERETERELEIRQLTLSGVRRDTAMAWLDRYYVERMHGALLAIAQDSRDLIEAAEAAYRGGRGSQSDILAARSALVMVDDRRSMLERQLRLAGIALARWIGPQAGRGLAGDPDIRAVNLQIDQLEDALRHHPQLTTLAKQIELAEIEAKLAQAATKPDWSLEFAYSQRGAGFANMISVGVSIPLQISRAERQDRDAAAKLAKVDQIRAQFEDAQRAHTAEVQAMIADWKTGLERLDRIEASLFPLARQRSHAALAAYRGNVGPLAAVLEARRNEQEVRLQALQIAGETARAWAQLNFLLPAEHTNAEGAK